MAPQDEDLCKLLPSAEPEEVTVGAGKWRLQKGTSLCFRDG